MVDEGTTAEAGGAGTTLANGKEGGGADGAQPHGGGNLSDQQREALVKHVGQTVSHREAAQDERAVVLDAGDLGCYRSCGGQ